MAGDHTVEAPSVSTYAVEWFNLHFGLVVLLLDVTVW